MKKEVVLNENRDFKGVWIPKELYLNINLTWNEKIILIEINSLSKNGECFANNQHFANLLGITKKTVENIISGLRKKGYIKTEIKYKGNTKEVDKRILRLIDPYTYGNNNTYPKNNGEGTHENEDKTPHKNKGDKNTLSSDSIKESKNIDNKECISETEIHLTDDELSEKEENAGQWHWKSQKQYVDYIEKIMPKYIQEIASEEYGKKSQSAYNVLLEFAKMFYSKYRRFNGKFHPWYKKETLSKCFNSAISFFVDTYDHADSEMIADYINQFYEHESMANKPLAVFCTTEMLEELRKEIEQDWY